MITVQTRDHGKVIHQEADGYVDTDTVDIYNGDDVVATHAAGTWSYVIKSQEPND